MFHKKTVARKDNNKRSRRTIEEKRRYEVSPTKEEIRRVLNLLDKKASYIRSI